MPTFLSPGVFTREIDLSVLPTAAGPIRPAFVGTAKKGPMNTVTLITSAQEYIDTFGEPFPESYLGYAVLTYLEEGDQCYVMRVGVECETGQVDALSSICVDTSGNKGKGWGRIALFKGIDYGRINLRQVTSAAPLVFHDASTGAVDYNDVDTSSTYGATSATLNISGAYTGSVDDAFIMIITSAPSVSEDASVSGAGYQIIKNSTGAVVAEGYLDDPGDTGVSSYISIGDGLSVQVAVTSGVLDVNDTFSFTVVPDNRDFVVEVDGDAAPTTYTMTAGTYSTAASFVSAINALLSGEDYQFVEYTLADGTSTIPQIRTDVAGSRIQLTGTAAFALECGTQQYAWDIPRSYLMSNNEEPFDITTSNNRVKINVIGAASTQAVEFSVPVGIDQTAESVAASIDTAGVVAGEIYWDSFELTSTDGESYVVIAVSDDHMLDTLEMLANYSNIKTLRFAEELNIPYPYMRAYRGFSDNRVILPDSGTTTSSIPLSCELDAASDECTLDTSYFANVVGYLVAPSAGTWVTGMTVTLTLYTGGAVDAAGNYTLIVKGAQGEVLDQIQNVSFDKRATRYIGNVLNPGTSLGGTRGNSYLNWEPRPSYLNYDTTDLTTYEVRLPAQFANKAFAGQANGVPTSATYSSEVDAVVIGNQALSTGLYAFENPESYDINILCTPGFSSGSVIGTALQVCESRGDCIYLVDPPFGLRPQQTIDWHNGILTSDLSASIDSSYGSLYSCWLKIYDQFSADEIWVPPSGFAAGVYSRTAREAEQWYAPAGVNRGRLLTALDVEYSPSRGEQDLLYGSDNAVNPIIKHPQYGILIWGQRTLQRADTALDRVNVRMLLSYMKKNCTRLLQNFVHEPNDSALWSQISASLSPFIGDIQARRGITAYKIVVDSSNNTPDRIDRGEIWVTIYFKPTKAAEFIVLNLVNLRQGASFSAEEVLAAGGVTISQTT